MVRKRLPSIAIVANTDWSLFNFRKGLVNALQNHNWHVIGMCSEIGFMNNLKTLNLGSLVKIKKYIKNISPLDDIQLFMEYYQWHRKLRPDIVHHFTIKPVIYGSIAAKLAGVSVITNTITGLGYVFTEGHAKHTWLKFFVLGLYKLSASVSDFFWFQNEQDKDYFIRHKILNEHKCGVIFGSGVDLEYFSAEKVSVQTKQTLRRELKFMPDDVVVLMIARMLYDKGIREFIAAARNIIKKISGVKFILVGPLAPGNPSMIPLEQINGWVREGIVKYLGRRADVRELMSLADIVVLPSYREGIPKSLLEAAAMGKPIITTDTVGCREVVNDGENGFLVPVKNSAALQDAIEKLLLNPKLRTVMGEQSRQRAINEFDEKKVIAQTLITYEKLFARKGIKVAFGDLGQ